VRFLNLSTVIATNVDMALITSIASGQSGRNSSCGIMQFAETANVVFQLALSSVCLSVCLYVCARYLYSERITTRLRLIGDNRRETFIYNQSYNVRNQTYLQITDNANDKSTCSHTSDRKKNNYVRSSHGNVTVSIRQCHYTIVRYVLFVIELF